MQDYVFYARSVVKVLSSTRNRTGSGSTLMSLQETTKIFNGTIKIYVVTLVLAEKKIIETCFLHNLCGLEKTTVMTCTS